MVERTHLAGAVLRLKLEPLLGERVKILEYHRKTPGERWQRAHEEEGRVVVYNQLKLVQPFDKLFSHWHSLT